MILCETTHFAHVFIIVTGALSRYGQYLDSEGTTWKNARRKKGKFCFILSTLFLVSFYLSLKKELCKQFVLLKTVWISNLLYFKRPAAGAYSKHTHTHNTIPYSWLFSTGFYFKSPTAGKKIKYTKI